MSTRLHALSLAALSLAALLALCLLGLPAAAAEAPTAGLQTTWNCWENPGTLNPCRKALNGIDALTANDVWAVGADGLILH